MRRNNSRRQPNVQQRRRTINPPQISSNIHYVHKFRFRSTTDSAVAITENDLFFVAGAMCTVANSACMSIAKAVKLRSVKVWSPPSAQGSAVTCSVTWKSTGEGFGSPQLEVSDSSLSVSVPAHVHAVPPAGSIASFWLNTDNDEVMTLVAPTGSIIDVVLEIVLADTGATTTSISVAAGTLGVLYYFPLDGDGDNFLPVSLTTTT
jgi:hypothetical protein